MTPKDSSLCPEIVRPSKMLTVRVTCSGSQRSKDEIEYCRIRVAGSICRNWPRDNLISLCFSRMSRMLSYLVSTWSEYDDRRVYKAAQVLRSLDVSARERRLRVVAG